MHIQRSWSAKNAALAIVAITFMLASGAWAATEQVLFNFTGSDGSNPRSALIIDGAGNIYGTASSGGDTKDCTSGCGVVFELSPTSGGGWTQTVLHAFNGKDGAYPTAGLVFDKAGNLYGTTFQGGAHNDGVVFELIPGSAHWTEKVLHTFDLGYRGQFPVAGLIIDGAGNLYGTTEAGYFGAVFELTPTSSGWTFKVLHSFRGSQGKHLFGKLVLDHAGNLYGTTANGGHGNGGGIVFELTPSASGPWTETVLYEFQGGRHGGKDGREPMSDLVFDGQGNLYGTTFAGGVHAQGRGTIFKLTPSSSGWTETILHYGGAKGGFGYRSGLIVDASGNLYGTADYGGGFRRGTVFRLTPTATGFWKETVLHSFGGAGDGINPVAGLVRDAAGNLYGTTLGGGTASVGTVFEVTP